MGSFTHKRPAVKAPASKKKNPVLKKNAKKKTLKKKALKKRVVEKLASTKKRIVEKLASGLSSLNKIFVASKISRKRKPGELVSKKIDFYANKKAEENWISKAYIKKMAKEASGGSIKFSKKSTKLLRRGFEHFECASICPNLDIPPKDVCGYTPQKRRATSH